jgi:hypothetical protein
VSIRSRTLHSIRNRSEFDEQGLRELGEKPEFLQPLEHLAAVLKALGQHDRAVRLWGAAQACRDVLSVPRVACDTDEYDRQVSAARTALGEEGFAAMWAQGQAMGADQAIAYATQDESCAHAERQW